MALPIVLSARAIQDVDESYRWWFEHRSFAQARRWRDLCVRTIDSLPAKASASRMAAEADEFPLELRQLSFGLGRRPTHRIVFTIRPDMIHVLRVRHLAQDTLTLDDV